MMNQLYDKCYLSKDKVVFSKSINNTTDENKKNIIYNFKIQNLNMIINYLPHWLKDLQINIYYCDKYHNYDKLPINMRMLTIDVFGINIDNFPILLKNLYIRDYLNDKEYNKYCNLPSKLETINIECLCFHRHKYYINLTENILHINGTKVTLIYNIKFICVSEVIKYYKILFKNSKIEWHEYNEFVYIEIT